MKVMIIGAGAMGCLYAAKIAESGAEVFLVAKNRDYVSKVNENGIEITGTSGKRHAKVKAGVVADAGRFDPDLAIFCVKAYSTVQAAHEMKGAISEVSMILTLQNGLGNLEALESAYGRERVFAGTTSQGATLLAPGQVRHAGTGATVIGSPEGERRSAEDIAMFLSDAGFPATVTDDVQSMLWSKLILNVAVNPLTAILDVENGALMSIPHARSLMEAAVLEAAAVAEKAGVKLEYADPVERVHEIVTKTASNISSMRQDIIHGRKTEIDYINGAVVREASKHEEVTPVNVILTNLVKALETGSCRNYAKG